LNRFVLARHAYFMRPGRYYRHVVPRYVSHRAGELRTKQVPPYWAGWRICQIVSRSSIIGQPTLRTIVAMVEFKESIPHTGGIITIRKRGQQYSLGYRHVGMHAASVVQLLAVDGRATAVIPIGGLYLRDDPAPPQLRVLVPSDRHEFGRQCPKCKSYFRTETATTELCAYCDHSAPVLDFLTDYQREFVKTEYEAILKALLGEDGETAINLDAKIAEPSIADPWVYSEEKQQTHFKCAGCGLQSDVLGEYVRCPQCGTRTARAVIERKLNGLTDDFESDAKTIATEDREQRQRRWRYYVPTCVAEFEALGRDLAVALARLPLTPARRTALLGLSFQNVLTAALHLKEWYGFDILDGISEDDRTFLHRMFNRRHLFSHCGGKVDQEYLDRTDDTTVRLNEVVTVKSKEVRRLLALVHHVAVNFLAAFDSIS
jgi:Zn finger protein HypA/HybF involved in hydrogenase expression